MEKYQPASYEILQKTCFYIQRAVLATKIVVHENLRAPDEMLEYLNLQLAPLSEMSCVIRVICKSYCQVPIGYMWFLQMAQRKVREDKDNTGFVHFPTYYKMLGLRLSHT